MWGWIPFFLMLFMKVAGATPILPRDVTVTRTASNILSTRFITRTTKGALNTVTSITRTAVLTTETLDNLGKTITPSDTHVSKISAGRESVIGETAPNPVPTPTPSPGPANDPAIITTFVTLNQSATYSTVPPSISPSPSALRTNQDVVSVSATSSSSTQNPVQPASKDAKDGNGQSKPKKYNPVVVAGGIMIGISFISILLFVMYLKWRREQKAARALFSPTEGGYQSTYDSARELGTRIDPFPQSVSPSTPNHKPPASATPWAPTVTLSPLPSGGPYSYSQRVVSTRPTKHLPMPPVLTLPTPKQSTTHTPRGGSNSRNDLTISRDMILRGPPTPPPNYTA